MSKNESGILSGYISEIMDLTSKIKSYETKLAKSAATINNFITISKENSSKLSSNSDIKSSQDIIIEDIVSKGFQDLAMSELKDISQKFIIKYANKKPVGESTAKNLANLIHETSSIEDLQEIQEIEKDI